MVSHVAAAVYFLWHFPWGRPRRPLAGTVFPWSPDFPPAGVAASQRLPGRLEMRVVGRVAAQVNRAALFSERTGLWSVHADIRHS
jgi:hypothetical protein